MAKLKTDFQNTQRRSNYSTDRFEEGWIDAGGFEGPQTLHNAYMNALKIRDNLGPHTSMYVIGYTMQIGQQIGKEISDKEYKELTNVENGE